MVKSIICISLLLLTLPINCLTITSISGIHSTPPPSSQGTTVLVGDNPSGIFTGHENALATVIFWRWTFEQVAEGSIIYNLSRNEYYVFVAAITVGELWESSHWKLLHDKVALSVYINFDYAIDRFSQHRTFIVDTGSTDIEIELPFADQVSMRLTIIKSQSANEVIISVNSVMPRRPPTGTINGQTTLVLSNQFDNVTLQSTGADGPGDWTVLH